MGLNSVIHSQNPSSSLTPQKKSLSDACHFFLIPWTWLHLMKCLDPLNRLLLYRHLVKCWLTPKQVLPWEDIFSCCGDGRTVFLFIKKVCSVIQDVWISKIIQETPFPPHNQPLYYHLCIFMKITCRIVKKTILELKNTFPTCVWIEKLSHYFLFFHVYLCKKQVMFPFSCLLFSAESKLHMSPESFILSVLFTDICRQLKGSFCISIYPHFNISCDTSCITYSL